MTLMSSPAQGGRVLQGETAGRLVMDFNPLMLLAGNSPSIIQGSEEEGRRKRQSEREVREKGGKGWRKGNRQEGGRDRDVGVSHGKVPPPPVTQQLRCP